MIKKRDKTNYRVHEHLEHWVTKTNYNDRLQWLEEANDFIRALRRKKNYPNLSRKS
ncbi:MAG: hypothetical protein JW847_06075 [Candidatus Omnitrophica bacterium]|nr:hypothetical protein [Candidatus Omnitrophota bacterium]